jgi:hypothetical protein
MAKITRSQAYKYRENILKISKNLSDEDALNSPLLFPKWKAKQGYIVGDRVAYEVDEEVKLYKVLQDHVSQADWTPDVAVSLYVEIDDPSIEWPEWKQPAGAHNAYPRGAKVSHNGKHWINTIDSNVYEPGVYGWEEQN